MPTYSYRCRDCAVEFDIHQEFTDPALSACPQCGGSLRKLFSAVGVTFQGSGFYRTDSRAPQQQPSTKSDSVAPSPSSDSAGASSAAPASAPKTPGGSAASSSASSL